MISIIIPIWGDYYKYLNECLEFIDKQTYRDFEIITVHTPNLPKARNEGIKKAKGEYVFPLDVDDKLDKDYLLEVSKETADVITTEHLEFGDHQARSIIPNDFTLEMILRGEKPIACSVFRKSMWEKIGGYDESFSQGFEDWDFWIRMCKAGASFKKIPKILYYYRKHKGQMSEDIHKNEDLFNKLKEKHKEL